MSERGNSVDSFEIISLPKVNPDETSYIIVEDMADASEKQQYAILLHSVFGYRQLSWLKDTKDWVLGKQYTQKNIISGTLLEALSEKEILLLAQHLDPILNYKVLSSDKSQSSDHVVWLHCKPKQVKALNHEEMKYLQAVKGLNDRLEALPKLDWIGSLNHGTGVFLNYPDVFDHPVKVTIRYVGPLPGGELGTHFGVELLELRNRGTTDGSFQDYRLFDCSKNCGLFVSMDKIVLVDDEIQPVTRQPQRQSCADDKPYKKYDRVEAYDVNGASVKGTVMWIGKNIEALPNGAYIVGIHADQVIHQLKNRFPYHISTMNHYVESSKEHSSLLLPMYFVKKCEVRVDDGGAASHGHKHDTRFAQHNRSYNPQDSMSTTIAGEAKRQGIRTTMVKENQMEVLKKAEQRKEEVRKEQEQAKSNERRLQMQQIKNELQIGEIEGFDDTMLDRKRQEKILEDLKLQNKESQQNSSQTGKTKATYTESPPMIPESQSTASAYQHDHQLHNEQQGTQQDPHAQGMYFQKKYPQGMAHQGLSHEGTNQQGVSQHGMGQHGMGQLGVNQHGVDQHGMGQLGVSQQGMTQQGMTQQGMGYQYQGVGHQDITQQGMAQQDQQAMVAQQGITQQGIYPQCTPQQSTYPPPQNVHSQGMFKQEIHQHGMPQQDIHSQGVYQQGWPHQVVYPQEMHSQEMFQQQLSQQGIHSQALQPQGMNNSNIPQPDPYQRSTPQNYQSQQYNLSPNKGNWQGENPPYPMERQHSNEFRQILRAERNVPNNNSGDAPQTAHTRQYQNTSQDMYGRPSEPHRQTEVSHNMPPLEVGDVIQSGNNPISYGTIKWIGELPGSLGLIAGIEMEEPVTGATDGWHDSYQYFMCERGKGLFLRLAALRRDDRFMDVKGQTEAQNPLGKFDLNNSIEFKTFLQPSEKVIEHMHTGRGKGIQGHQNSCYLDSTLYGLFAFSGAFDDLFLKQASDEIGRTIKSTLQAIVNTLRHNNVVLYNHIMILREKLDKLQHLKGLKSDEKDPEEFLNLLFKHVLNVEAFLRIKRPFGTDKEFFVQLFVEGDKHNIPRTQDLLTEMFKEQQITFAKYPLRLLLQIPRYGKQFKTFKGVIPSLELDVTALCEQYAGNCIICGVQGTEFCADCGTSQQQEIKLKENSCYFCKDCVTLWHKRQDRRDHKPVSRHPNTDGGDPGRLRLLSVLCIETSHYVCFTRVQGSGTNEWVFFDSMAERPDDVHNVPCVTQCTQQLNEWVYGDKDLTKYNSKELPPLVRRFVEDGYLCIYVDQDGIMYGDDGGTP